MAQSNTIELPSPGDNIEVVIVRSPRPRVHPVPGEIFTLPVEHSWVFGHTPYVRGNVTATSLDGLRLRLEGLGGGAAEVGGSPAGFQRARPLELAPHTPQTLPPLSASSLFRSR